MRGEVREDLPWMMNLVAEAGERRREPSVKPPVEKGRKEEKEKKKEQDRGRSKEKDRSRKPKRRKSSGSASKESRGKKKISLRGEVKKGLKAVFGGTGVGPPLPPKVRRQPRG